MKITIKTNNKIYSAEEDLPFGDGNIDDAVEMFKGLLVSAGFHPCNVDDRIISEGQWFTDEERADNMQGHLKEEDLSFDSRAFETSKEDEEKLERLCRDRKVQEFQDNMYKQDDEDIFS